MQKIHDLISNDLILCCRCHQKLHYDITTTRGFAVYYIHYRNESTPDYRYVSVRKVENQNQLRAKVFRIMALSIDDHGLVYVVVLLPEM